MHKFAFIHIFSHKHTHTGLCNQKLSHKHCCLKDCWDDARYDRKDERSHLCLLKDDYYRSLRCQVSFRLKNNNNNCVITTVVLYIQITRCKIDITTEHLLSKEGRGFTLFVFQGTKQKRKNMYKMKRFCPETVNRIVECSYNSESTHVL